MEFFTRHFEPAWRAARDRLARLVDAPPASLALVENATAAMNTVANSFPLREGDEVLLNDHEYGAVRRLWSRAASRAGARVCQVTLPFPCDSFEALVDSILAGVTARTRLIVVSHITSPTAMILPVATLCRGARQRGVAVCVDGPHAPAQLPLSVASLECDFYTASCHKWLSAPFGSGFLYVAEAYQSRIEPPLLSWGRLLPAQPECWSDEFIWTGTRDPTAYLAIPAAIDFLDQVGFATFRETTHRLARSARQELSALTGLAPPLPDRGEWFGSMITLPLPAHLPADLQAQLKSRFGIEVPVVEFGGHRWLRVSCHLYNSLADIRLLGEALRALGC